MKLVVFGPRRLGCLADDGSIIDLNYAYAALLKRDGVARCYAKADAEVPSDLLEFIVEGPEGLEAANEAVSLVREGLTEGPRGEKLIYKAGEVKVHAPLPSLASRIAMAGANFYDHAAGVYSMRRGEKVTVEEVKRDVEAGRHAPWGFWKFPRNVVGPGEPVIYPARTRRLDYEVEVAAIIGRRGKDIPEDEAMDHIYGYTIVNDISARDQDLGGRGLALSKNFDTSAPMGPCIVTADEVGDPHTLGMRLKINGATRQDSSMRDMIRKFPFWISFLTRDMTFYPGDIICGGTCAGTALDTSPADAEGRTKPDKFLKPGDVIEAWVEKIGTLRNPVKAKC
ncbi:MAG: fumarylacetoacetate hydrolase family protein [Candidatus Bathyarchaeia archaeon]